MSDQAPHATFGATTILRLAVKNAGRWKQVRGSHEIPAYGFERVTDLSSARAAFGTLSDALLIAAKRTGRPLDAGVKVAYCPMARKHCLQTGETIDNPYYGAAMRTCGRFEVGIPDPD